MGETLGALSSPYPNYRKAMIMNSVVEEVKKVPDWDSYDWTKATTKFTIGLATGLASDKGLSKLSLLTKYSGVIAKVTSKLPITPLSKIKIGNAGIDKVRKHLNNFNKNAPRGKWSHNEHMMDRL